MGDSTNIERVVFGRVDVPAPVADVWRAWTTEEGAQGFFAPKCRIDLRPGGSYEMLFDLDAEQGKQGAEGMMLLAIQPERMLAFTWNAPPHLPKVRGQMTHVVVRMSETETGETRVILRHDGWGEGDEWDDAFQYFSRVWPEVVLRRLRYRFQTGPVDWNTPPSLDESGEESAQQLAGADPACAHESIVGRFAGPLSSQPLGGKTS
jgi:uncharacterized protein YndB with AHSA1/START domain